jgi:predicted DCC family thiol-disulfide oxidoreductase YuxK
MIEAIENNAQKILFFDGVCVMCNGLVDFTLKHDKKARINFAPLQGSTAHALVPEYTESLNTVVFIAGDKIFTESDAIIRVFCELGGIFCLAKIFVLVPKFFRDPLYRFVAKNRYRWFGKHESCRLPSPSERKRLLD